ncbi:MAG: GMC family oxidoreductase [Cytophagales bacterium]|nr:GMC family oxidoreductase [Cytophagales bacterium]
MDGEFDYIVIGSGFGGSVSAMRLSEKGYSVLVLEKGKRFKPKDFPKTDWNFRKFLWMPKIKWFGFQNLTFFRQVTILSGVGVGGGSIVYGNTHMFPPDRFFNNPVWTRFKDWKNVLTPFYDVARKMLGTVPLTDLKEEDLLLREVATEMGKADSFSGVNVGVYFGDTDKETDPYFNGKGPMRTGCTACAGCMVGCRYNAKNTLDKNYLYFAEQHGAKIKERTYVYRIEYTQNKYVVYTKQSGSWFKKHKRTFIAKGLIVSGGVLGTMNLLLKQKYKYKTLPNLSDQLGEHVLTNSESLCGVSNADRKLNNGVAISSYFNPDEHTHIEIVKYNDRSGAMGRLGTLAVGSGSGIVRFAKWVLTAILHPIKLLRLTFTFKNWGRNSIIFLVMQSLDNSMRLIWKKGIIGSTMSFKNDKAAKVPAYIPIGQEVMKRYAGKVNGIAQNVWPEILLNIPMTAHILGGCPMGNTKDEGVVDDKFEVYGYKNMYILDGSVIPCNLGVNPSLTITALAEYAMDQVPEKS